MVRRPACSCVQACCLCQPLRFPQVQGRCCQSVPQQLKWLGCQELDSCQTPANIRVLVVQDLTVCGAPNCAAPASPVPTAYVDITSTCLGPGVANSMGRRRVAKPVKPTSLIEVRGGAGRCVGRRLVLGLADTLLGERGGGGAGMRLKGRGLRGGPRGG